MNSKLIFILIFFLSPTLILAQEDTKVKTDSSVIITKYFDYLNAIRVFNELKDKNKSYYKEYYYDTKTLKETGVFINGDCFGIWKEFWPNGKLKRQIDYNKGIITFNDKKAYPHNGYLNKVKLKADSILKSIYSQTFYNKYIIWDINHSNVSTYTIVADWTDSLEMKPNEFLMRYKIKFNGDTYPEIIEFTIDSMGRFKSGEDIKGLEKLPVNSPKDFKLTADNSIKIAKQKGLVETTTSKAESFLKWEYSKSDDRYHGHFRLNVIIKTKSIKNIKIKGRSTIIDKYDEYVFNPWTGEFIGMKKMKTYRGWEQNSGSSSGLIPDE